MVPFLESLDFDVINMRHTRCKREATFRQSRIRLISSLTKRLQKINMAQDAVDKCEFHQNGDLVDVTMDFFNIDLENDEIQNRPKNVDTFCSRNVLRKQRHWENLQVAKKGKRKDEKIRRKLSRLQESEHGACMDSAQLTKRVLKAITKERLAAAHCRGPKICVDLSMTDCLSNKEICRLAGQIRRLYGSNKKANQPFHVFLTNLQEDSRLYRECLRMNDGFQHYSLDITEESCLDRFPSEKITYLSPDAEEALERVDDDGVYILGGLVDESIQKKISYLKAKELNVQTARLPIDEYMVKWTNPKNFHSKILPINQVFDILLTIYDTGSWTKALGAWFPQGKGFVVAPDHYLAVTQTWMVTP